MKITIEMDNTYHATVEIDGRELTYGYRDGVLSFTRGLGSNEHKNTIGGMVATKLAESCLREILQGHMTESGNSHGDCWGTWDILPDDVADEVYEALD